MVTSPRKTEEEAVEGRMKENLIPPLKAGILIIVNKSFTLQSSCLNHPNLVHLVRILEVS